MRRTVGLPVIAGLVVGGIALGRWVGPSPVQGQFAPPVTNIPKELTSYRDVVKAVLPSVVSIVPKANRARMRGRIGLPENAPEELKRFFEQQSQNPQNQNLGFGSGFVVDPSGVILTNYHVIEDADSVDITMSDGRKFTSSDIKGDPSTDIAVIRIKADGPLPALQFGDSSEMELGDRVLAIGAPFGLTGSVSHGIISAKGRDIRQNPRQSDDLIQTDAAINPGNSGGPLVNLAGQVVGVTNSIKSRSGGFQGVAFAISGNQARSVMKQLVKDGVVRRGYLGIEMARGSGEPGGTQRGIAVSRVLDNTPASKAGFKVDDVIVSIDGKPIREQRQLQKIVGELPLNQAIKVEVLRDGKPMQLSVTIEEAPTDYGLEKRQP